MSLYKVAVQDQIWGDIYFGDHPAFKQMRVQKDSLRLCYYL